MAENPPSEGTRKLEEDGGPEDCYDSDDDLIMYADGRKMSIHLQKEYHRQVKESEENKPKFVDLSQLAIATFNSQNATKYEFVKNVTVNTSYAAGMWCYITFQARDADDTIKTFQALAWWGIDGDRDVRFCRFKKSSKC
uniref:Uncharacterized protein isoform X2 n=1 Tax=Nicotiana tabacum TaxID=4097 RepID=A0A1S4D2U4_TOBAC|nr:PREDICTED: uncharacterized protein LOC107825271 isoform X2 [Nicotiana tabacum]